MVPASPGIAISVRFLTSFVYTKIEKVEQKIMKKSFKKMGQAGADFFKKFDRKI